MGAKRKEITKFITVGGVTRSQYGWSKVIGVHRCLLPYYTKKLNSSEKAVRKLLYLKSLKERAPMPPYQKPKLVEIGDEVIVTPFMGDPFEGVAIGKIGDLIRIEVLTGEIIWKEKREVEVKSK